MQLPLLARLLLLLAAAASPAAPALLNLPARQGDPKVVSGLPPLIPMKLLLGNRAYKDAQVSSDGLHLSYIKPDPKHGVDNIFVRRLPSEARLAALRPDAPLLEQHPPAAAEERQVTFDIKQGVHTYSWAADGSALFYLQDNGGDEMHHLYMAPVSTSEDDDGNDNAGGSGSGGRNASSSSGAGGKSRAGQGSAGSVSKNAGSVNLTPFPGVKVQGLITSHRHPRRLYFSMNARDPSAFDLYELNLDTRAATLHTVNPGGVETWLVDYDFNVRGGDVVNRTDGSYYVIINDDLPPLSGAAADGGNGSNAQKQPPKQQQQQRQAPAAAGCRNGAGGSANRSSAGAAKAPLRCLALPELLAAARRGNWSFDQWVAASSSGARVKGWRTLLTFPPEEEGSVLRFNRAGDGLYVLTTANSITPGDTTELHLISTAPGAKVLKRIAENPDADTGAVVFDPVSWEPQLVSFTFLKPTWRVLDPAIARDWRRLQTVAPDGAPPSIVSRTPDGSAWVVAYIPDASPSRYYLYRPGGRWPPQLLFVARPDLAPGSSGYALAAMHAAVLRARDGLRLPAYLTLPVRPGVVPAALPACVAGDVPDGGAPSASNASSSSSASNATCPLRLRLPMVLLVHGGPWARDVWGFDGTVQMLANRGYAVLQVQFRGSKGYGSAFLSAGDRQWGRAMQDDLTDAVAWAVSKGVADPTRVCIMGGSYGGYAALAGLAFTPGVYACGVDLVGIANIGTFLHSIPPYWQAAMADLVRRVGNLALDDPFNDAISPVRHVDKIRAPLLIGQGARDPRVPKAESDQIYAAMKAAGRGVEYVLYPDEGHGLARPDNRLDFFSRAEHFLARHLGGRAGAQGDVPGSSAQVFAR